MKAVRFQDFAHAYNIAYASLQGNGVERLLDTRCFAGESFQAVACAGKINKRSK